MIGWPSRELITTPHSIFWIKSLHLPCSQITFSPANFPVVSNVTARPLALDDAAAIQEELTVQTYSPVRWVESVRAMFAGGATRFVEIGTGKVLTGLIKRIEKGAELVNSEDVLKA